MARRRTGQPESEGHNFWQSYSDMMAGLLLTFILIICGALLMLMGVKNSYDESELALAAREAQLEEEISAKLSYADLSEQQKAQLAEQQSLLDEQQRQLDEQQAQLAAQKLQLDASKTLLSTQQALLTSQQQELEDVIGIKRDLVEALSQEFAGTDLDISIDEHTGAILLDSSVLFALNDSRLSSDGSQTLSEFLPRYFSVVLSDDYIDHISEIIIEGHTDTAGSYIYNLFLSEERAAAVADYCLDDDQSLFDAETLEAVRSLVTVSGRSFSDPVYNDDGTVNADASRRVEIKFRLSDDEMINRMLDILDAYGEAADTPAAPEGTPAP